MVNFTHIKIVKGVASCVRLCVTILGFVELSSAYSITCD